MLWALAFASMVLIHILFCVLVGPLSVILTITLILVVSGILTLVLVEVLALSLKGGLQRGNTSRTPSGITATLTEGTWCAKPEAGFCPHVMCPGSGPDREADSLSASAR